MTFLVDFVVKGMVLVIYFWSVLSSLLQHVRDLLEFAPLMSLDRSHKPRCLFCNGWLPGLTDIGGNDPWALSFDDLASAKLERCLGAYPVDFAGSWTPPEYWDADDTALEMSEYPNVWSDGSREDFSSGGFEVAGAVGERQKSMVMLDWSVAVLLCLFPVSCRLFDVLNSGALLLPCRRTGLAIQVLKTLMLLGL